MSPCLGSTAFQGDLGTLLWWGALQIRGKPYTPLIIFYIKKLFDSIFKWVEHIFSGRRSL